MDKTSIPAESRQSELQNNSGLAQPSAISSNQQISEATSGVAENKTNNESNLSKETIVKINRLKRMRQTILGEKLEEKPAEKKQRQEQTRSRSETVEQQPKDGTTKEPSVSRETLRGTRVWIIDLEEDSLEWFENLSMPVIGQGVLAIKVKPERLFAMNKILEGWNAKYINSISVVRMKNGPTFACHKQGQSLRRCHESYRVYETRNELRPDQAPLKIAHQRKSDVTLLGEKKGSGSTVKAIASQVHSLLPSERKFGYIGNTKVQLNKGWKTFHLQQLQQIHNRKCFNRKLQERERDLAVALARRVRKAEQLTDSQVKELEAAETSEPIHFEATEKHGTETPSEEVGYLVISR